MKKYLIDQVLFLLCGVLIEIGLVIIFPGTWFVVFLEVLTAATWLYLCSRLILLPIDLVMGKVKQIVYFSSKCGRDKLEFFKNTYCDKWRFYFGGNKKLVLLVPVTYKSETEHGVEPPKSNDKLMITYFRFSKILYRWERI